MGGCKCKTRIISEAIKQANGNGKMTCFDVCTNPICDTPRVLSLMEPLIYDEIGVNLCATFTLDGDISEAYPTAVSAAVDVINITYDYGEGGVQIENISGRPNCYLVTMSNIAVLIAIRLYDYCCRYLGTIYETVSYLPSDTTTETYNEDTNPSSIELEIFAPYGVSYDTSGAEPTMVLNNISFSLDTNIVRQGLSLYAMPKVIDIDVMDSTLTLGLTLVLMSIYFAGYKVETIGKIDVPKGSLSSSDTECIKFVEGDLLNLAIKPLDLGYPFCEENLKNDLNNRCVCDAVGGCPQDECED